MQAGAGIYTLAINNGSTNRAKYSSRESQIPAQRPLLRLELDVPTTTTTTTSPPTTSTTETTVPPSTPTTTTTTLPTVKPAGPLHLLAGPSAACRLVAAVTGWSWKGPAVRCTDGDTCDADGAADGSCTAPVTLCLESSAAPGCGPDVLATLKLSSDPRLQA